MVHERIDEYRAKHNEMSTREFERKCGLKNGTIGKWRAKGYRPRLETLERIAKATNTSMGYWLR